MSDLTSLDSCSWRILRPRDGENEPLHYVARPKVYVALNGAENCETMVWGVSRTPMSVPARIWPILPMVFLSRPPLARQLPKNIGLSMKALRVLSINGGWMTAFVNPRSLLPGLLNYETPVIVCHHVNCVSLKVQGPWTRK